MNPAMNGVRPWVSTTWHVSICSQLRDIACDKCSLVSSCHPILVMVSCFIRLIEYDWWWSGSAYKKFILHQILPGEKLREHHHYLLRHDHNLIYKPRLATFPYNGRSPLSNHSTFRYAQLIASAIQKIWQSNSPMLGSSSVMSKLPLDSEYTPLRA